MTGLARGARPAARRRGSAVCRAPGAARRRPRAGVPRRPPAGHPAPARRHGAGALRPRRSAPSRWTRRSRPSGWRALLGRSRQAVKKVLMDQRHLAGVGNIYANEALFAAGIDPSRPAPRARAPDEYAGSTRRSAGSSRPPIASNGTTFRDYRTGTGERGQLPARAASSTAARASRAGRCGTRLTGTHADRRPDHRASAIAASRESSPRAPARRPLPVDRSRASSASGSARWPRTGPASIG